MKGLSNVKIMSDGTPMSTRVCVNDQPIEGVASMRWEMKSCDHIGVLTLTIEGAEIEADALRVLINDAEGNPL